LLELVSIHQWQLKYQIGSMKTKELSELKVHAHVEVAVYPRFRLCLTMVLDHGTIIEMEEIAISKFKATCLAVLERVRQTGKPILITRFGTPIAEVVPPPTPSKPKSWLGSMKGSARIVGDVVSPAGDPGDWEVLR
jgi:prevent-host-death family protein